MHVGGSLEALVVELDVRVKHLLSCPGVVLVGGPAGKHSFVTKVLRDGKGTASGQSERYSALSWCKTLPDSSQAKFGSSTATCLAPAS